VVKTRRLVILIVALACDVFTPKIHVVLRNTSGGDIDHGMVSFAGHDIPIGALPSGADASYGPVVTDVPADATISWQSADGRQHTQHVDVKSRIRDNRSGDLVFTIVASDRIEVSFVHLGD